VKVEVNLPNVKSAKEIDAYAENGVLEVEVEGMYSLRVPLHGHAIMEDELSCRFKKKEKKLIVSVPVLPAQESPPVPAEVTIPPPEESVPTPTESIVVPPSSAQEEACLSTENAGEQTHGAMNKATPSRDTTTLSSRESEARAESESEQSLRAMINAQASLALDTANLIDPDDEAFVVPKVELPEQEGLEHLKGPIEKVADAKIVDGVSDFSIFRHSLGKEFDAIYAATRANLPTIELEDEDYDDDAEVEVLNASEKLEALKQRTYKIVEAKGLHFTPAPESE